MSQFLFCPSTCLLESRVQQTVQIKISRITQNEVLPRIRDYGITGYGIWGLGFVGRIAQWAFNRENLGSNPSYGGPSL